MLQLSSEPPHPSSNERKEESQNFHTHTARTQRFHGSQAFQSFQPPRRQPLVAGEHQPAPVRVIAADGSLKELPSNPHVAVSDVLGAEAASFFVCNSDALYFNEPPPALAPGELLQPGQIYFVLPEAVLGRPLSSADMAGLAGRASAALAAKRPERRGGKNKKVRVAPVQEELQDCEDVLFNEKLNEQTLGEFTVATSPAKKSQEKLVARSRQKLKRALSIIQEMAE